MKAYCAAVITLATALTACGPATVSPPNFGDAATTDDATQLPSDTGTTPPDDAATAVDTGTIPPDDATTIPVDTGTPPIDTGTPPIDTGTPPIDTGTPPVDTGTTPIDTGTAPIDAGPPSVDAGPVTNTCLACATSRCDSRACLDDPVCLRCVQSNRNAPECASNMNFQRTLGCACAVCTSSCSRECSTEPPHDAGPPAPDAGPVSLRCSSCATFRCSAASTACFRDPVCTRCVQGNYSAPECAANANFQRSLECACDQCSGSCSTECSAVTPPHDAGAPDSGPRDAGPPADSGPTPPSRACQTCATRTCTSEGLACITDRVCAGCLQSGSTSPACLANAAFARLVLCGCTRCESDCADSCHL